MSEAPRSTPPSRGKFWRAFGVGDGVGRPLAEWAYHTPSRFDGIPKSGLMEADERIQFETALVWFGANFRPFEAAPDARFGFAEAGAKVGFGSSTYNSVPLNSLPHSDGSRFSDGTGYAQSSSGQRAEGIDAYTVLVAEFGDTLPPPLIERIALEVPGEWIQSWTFVPDMRPADALTKDEALTSILSRLEGLTDEIRALTDEYGSIGHNRPPSALPFDPEDQIAAERAVAELQTLATGSAETGLVLTQAQQTFHTLATKLGGYLVKQLDTFITEANKSVAKNVGNFILAAMTMTHLRELGALLRQAFHLLVNH